MVLVRIQNSQFNYNTFFRHHHNQQQQQIHIKKSIPIGKDMRTISHDLLNKSETCLTLSHSSVLSVYSHFLYRNSLPINAVEFRSISSFDRCLFHYFSLFSLLSHNTLHSFKCHTQFVRISLSVSQTILSVFALFHK